VVIARSTRDMRVMQLRLQQMRAGCSPRGRRQVGILKVAAKAKLGLPN
jgi:hypothetical protein